MDTKRWAAIPDPRTERQLGAILDPVDATRSIVDSLMEIPLPADDQAVGNLTEWDLAVLRRAESRLSAAIRMAIEGQPERKRA